MFVFKSLDFEVYVCFLKCWRFLRGFFLVYFMLFEQNEKLKPGGSVEAVVIPLTEL